jgi:hypothetical protein
MLIISSRGVQQLFGSTCEFQAQQDKKQLLNEQFATLSALVCELPQVSRSTANSFPQTFDSARASQLLIILPRPLAWNFVEGYIELRKNAGKFISLSGGGNSFQVHGSRALERETGRIIYIYNVHSNFCLHLIGCAEKSLAARGSLFRPDLPHYYVSLVNGNFHPFVLLATQNPLHKRSNRCHRLPPHSDHFTCVGWKKLRLRNSNKSVHRYIICLNT